MSPTLQAGSLPLAPPGKRTCKLLIFSSVQSLSPVQLFQPQGLQHTWHHQLLKLAQTHKHVYNKNSVVIGIAYEMLNSCCKKFKVVISKYNNEECATKLRSYYWTHETKPSQIQDEQH